MIPCLQLHICCSMYLYIYASDIWIYVYPLPSWCSWAQPVGPNSVILLTSQTESGVEVSMGCLNYPCQLIALPFWYTGNVYMTKSTKYIGCTIPFLDIQYVCNSPSSLSSSSHLNPVFLCRRLIMRCCRRQECNWADAGVSDRVAVERASGQG